MAKDHHLSVINEVKIGCGQDPPIVFNVDCNGYVHLSDIQKFFQQATGLFYSAYGKNYNVLIENGNKFKVIPGITQYQVFCFQNDEISDENNLPRLVQKYFHSLYTYEEICKMIAVHHNKKISVRTLKRILRRLRLKRKNIIESPKHVIIAAILKELEGPGKNIGYRAMHLRLKTKYHLHVKQATVLKYLWKIDPAGIQKRSKYRLKRRMYKVPGPNFIFHVDGHDKLKKFGFAINGCVDGFSRKVVYLHVSTTNNKPEVIAYYFLKALLSHNCMPCIVRSDHGTENTLIEVLQRALRRNHTDDNAGDKSFIKGKSTANERIEKYWKQLRNSTLEYYICLFKKMQEKNELDTSNIFEIELLRFCFGPLLEKDLERSTKEWNSHRIRQQFGIDIPCGIPSVIYYWPERYGARECKLPINQQQIQKLISKYTVKPGLYSSKTKKIIEMLMPDVKIPGTTEEAYLLFSSLKKLDADMRRH